MTGARHEFSHEGIWCRCQDRAGLDQLSHRTLPSIPQASECEQLPIIDFEAVGCLVFPSVCRVGGQPCGWSPLARTVREVSAHTAQVSGNAQVMNAHGAERTRGVWKDMVPNWDHKDLGRTEPLHALRFARKLHETSGHEEVNPAHPRCHRRTTSHVFPHGRNTFALSNELLVEGDGLAPSPRAS